MTMTVNSFELRHAYFAAVEFVHREATKTTSVIQELWQLDECAGKWVTDKASLCSEGSLAARTGDDRDVC